MKKILFLIFAILSIGCSSNNKVETNTKKIGNWMIIDMKKDNSVIKMAMLAPDGYAMNSTKDTPPLVFNITYIKNPIVEKTQPVFVLIGKEKFDIKDFKYSFDDKDFISSDNFKIASEKKEAIGISVDENFLNSLKSHKILYIKIPSEKKLSFDLSDFNNVMQALTSK